MNEQERNNISKTIIRIIQELQHNVADEEGWVDLACLGAPLTAVGIQYKPLGFPKLRPFLDEFQDVLELKKVEQLDEKPPIYYVRPRCCDNMFESDINLTLNCPLKVNQIYGSFKSFVHPKSEKILMCMEKFGVREFEENELNGQQEKELYLYRRIAETYDLLLAQDSDIKFSENTCQIRSGFLSESGDEIYLLCEPHKDQSRSKWYCDKAICAGKTFIFDKVNAYWYDIENELEFLLGAKCGESTEKIIDKITERNINGDSLVYLKEGKECTEEEADELYVPTDYNEPNGEEIYLFCTKRGGKRKVWNYNSLTYINAPLTVYEKKKWLEKWSGDIDTPTLEKLANQALPEIWSFKGREEYGILKNYLIYTFAHQYKKEIFDSEKNGDQYIAFNTGLADKYTYNYIYAFFERISNGGNDDIHPLYFRKKYVLKQFSLPGEAGNEYRKITEFPDPPKYFESRSKMVWKFASNEVNDFICNYKHILITNCERIPIDFYKQVAYIKKAKKLNGILDSNELNNQKYSQIRDYFRPIIDGTSELDDEVYRVYKALTEALHNIISKTMSKLSLNWRAVIPCYNPVNTEDEKDCFLLPISFDDQNEKPDGAMIAAVGTRIEIVTIITFEMAYLDARLVCRPESEWLAIDKVLDDEKNED